MLLGPFQSPVRSAKNFSSRSEGGREAGQKLKMCKSTVLRMVRLSYLSYLSCLSYLHFVFKTLN